ncbi:hypothetical protein OAK75_12415 [Bacteriovoracales bacterium]|nr:hypothetical protein [Bacteriovoracales bacterium]
MQKNGLTSPLLVKYLRAYEQNPKSRVFAPLAEVYRKLGMKEKAFDILKRGIKNHPAYPMGYLGLAFYYNDVGNNELAYSTLRPFVEGNRDNIRLQKLFGCVCQELGYLVEALETFKFLLFINPKDKGIADKVKELEQDGSQQVISEKFGVEEIPVDDLSLFDENNSSEWVQKDLTRPLENNQKDKEKLEEKAISRSKDDYIPFDEEISPVEDLKPDVEEAPLVEDLKPDVEDKELVGPVVTLTLVDLYCSQGYFNKAREVLDKIKALNPGDESVIKKYTELDILESKEKKAPHSGSPKLNENVASVEGQMIKFLERVKERAENFKQA